MVVGATPARLELQLKPSATLVGRAVDAITGAPIAGIHAYVSGEGTDTDIWTIRPRTRESREQGAAFLPKHDVDYDLETHPFTAHPGERVDLGTIAIVAPRTGKPGTFEFTTEVARDDRLVVTHSRIEALELGDEIETIDGRAFSLELAKRLLAYATVGQTLTLGLASGKSVTVTAVPCE